MLYNGILLQKKKIKKQGNFTFRLKLGEYEVDLEGTREEVVETIENLPNLITSVQKAFERIKPKRVATLTVKTKARKAPIQKYPKISSPENCGEAILKILGSDWGKWRPRTKEELEEAIKANKLEYSGRVLARVLNGFVKREIVRRWKTNSGDVYILAEEKP